VAGADAGDLASLAAQVDTKYENKSELCQL